MGTQQHTPSSSGFDPHTVPQQTQGQALTLQMLAALKERNRRHIVLEADNNVGQAESQPRLIAITALEQCNFRCVMCSQDHGSGKQISPLALARVETALLLAKDVCITGGEPFLYPGLDGFFRSCHQSACAPMVQTNGSLLLARQRRLLVDQGVAVLKISCDGATPATYNRIRRGGNFLKLFDNIQRLSELKAALGTELPVVEFNFVAMRSNIEELLHLTLMAAKLGVKAINVFLLLAETTEMARESLYFHQDLADKNFLRAADAGFQYGVDVRRPPLFCEQALFGEQAAEARRCYAPWEGMTVNVDGSVAICCGGAGVAGNLNEESFQAVWNHPRRRLVRETVNTERELPCCRACRMGRPVTDTISAHIPDPELAAQTRAYYGQNADGLRH